MYDVNFGGIEQMTKRLTIALVALAMFVLVAAMPVSAWNNGFYYEVRQDINQGASVFIGEQGLDITRAMEFANAQDIQTDITTIGWWASAAQIRLSAPDQTVDLTGRIGHTHTGTGTVTDPVRDVGLFTVTPAEFDNYAGEWYLVDDTDHNYAKENAAAVFNVRTPKIDVSIRDINQNNADVSGKSIPTGAELQFQIGTNMYTALGNARNNFEDHNITLPGQSDGYINIVVKPATGAVLGSLYTCAEHENGVCVDTGVARGIRQLPVATQPYTWGLTNGNFAWFTDARTLPLDDDNHHVGQKIYPPGTYTVSAESKLNNMYDNYLSGGAAYTGRTVSEIKTITLVSDTVSITVSKDSVVRSKPFSVTVTGKPTTLYNVWVKSTQNMALDEYNNAPPVVSKYQVLVRDGHIDTADYQYQNGAHNTIVPHAAFGGMTDGTVCDPIAYPPGTADPTYPDCWYSYAQITTGTTGTRVVEFATSPNTKAQKFTIRVERNDIDNDYDEGVFKGDEVDVKVEKGAVTIVASGDQSYYLGEEVKFSGTNTESSTTYLFIIGPNLDDDGAQLTQPREDAVSCDEETFAKADVLADNTWSYKWGTSKVPLDAGTYTIYAVSQPVNRDQTPGNGDCDGEESIATTAYGTVSIIIKKPFVSATASQSTVAKGDRVNITGTAEGQPSAGVAIWIMGKNFAFRSTETVNSDSSFKFEITQTLTRELYSGMYYVVVQHPMQNNDFDIYLAADHPAECPTNGRLEGECFVHVMNAMLGNTTADPPGSKIFLINGGGSLQGSDAANALVQAINDPNVDDTYTKFSFTVQEPQIIIDPIGDKRVGDTFTITAQTNLAIDDEVLVQVYSSSFKPTEKLQSGEFSGATGTVKVTKGDSGMNTISFPVNAATFKADEYIVTENAVIQDATGTALFLVLEGAAPTAKPTVVTTAAPTAVATAVPPTPVPPTPTPTKSPGYGALIALIGLGAVAFIVVRRH
jgi:PGF-CTERM protein